MEFYNFEVKDINGKSLSLDVYKNKVLLIVNVASQCGFTPQYESLETLYKKYRDKGFVILGFPCNQFGHQEPGNEEDIKKFCSTNYNITFPLFSKIDVNGERAHPLYRFLKKEKKGIFGTESIKWNFTKFLIDREGRVVSRYASKVIPEKITKDIEKLL